MDSAEPPGKLGLLIRGVGLQILALSGNLVSMTRIGKSRKNAGRQPRNDNARSGRWLLQDAKARFSELVRRVESEGPQFVTVHGREAVVVMSAEEFRRLKGDPNGRALVEVMQASPLGDLDIEPWRGPLPARDVDL